jgi:uncharacterized protein
MDSNPPEHVRHATTSLAAAYRPDGSVDLAAFADLLDPEVVLHVPGNNPLSGDHRGLAEVAAFAIASATATGGTESTVLIDTLVGQQHIAALVRVTAERPNATRLDNITMHLAKLGENGLITEIWFHNRDQTHVDAFWA